MSHCAFPAHKLFPGRYFDWKWRDGRKAQKKILKRKHRKRMRRFIKQENQLILNEYLGGDLGSNWSPKPVS